MKDLLIILVLLATASCSVEDMGSGTSIGSGELQVQLTSELDKADIPYKIDKDGFVRYNEKYQTIVESLTIQLLENQEREEQWRYGFKFADDINTTAFFAYLHHNGISTENLVHNVENHAVYWKKEDDQSMQEHLMAFLEEYREW